MAFGLLNKIQITGFKTPTIVYTAPTGGAVVDLIISNNIGIPVGVNVAVAPADPAVPEDYIAVNKALAPNLAVVGSTYDFRKLVMSAGEMIIVTMIAPEDADALYDNPAFAINVRVQGADGTELTTARYSY